MSEKARKKLYKSPIELICDNIQTQMEREEEKMVMKAIRKVGVNVDKEELIKALQYDRKQYKKGYDDGYADGKNDVLDKIRTDLHYNAEVHEDGNWYIMDEWLDDIFDKYKSESEVHSGN